MIFSFCILFFYVVVCFFKLRIVFFFSLYVVNVVFGVDVFFCIIIVVWYCFVVVIVFVKVKFLIIEYYVIGLFIDLCGLVFYCVIFSINIFCFFRSIFYFYKDIFSFDFFIGLLRRCSYILFCFFVFNFVVMFYM